MTRPRIMAEGEGQGAARRDVEFLVAGEPEVSVQHVQVGVAHAAPLDAHQYLGTLRHWTVDNGFDQRRPVGDEEAWLSCLFRYRGDVVSRQHRFGKRE